MNLSHRAHIAYALRFLRQGLPGSQREYDSSRVAVSFYCLAILDVLGGNEQLKADEKDEWRKWIWAQQVSGTWGTGFRGGPSKADLKEINSEDSRTIDPPMLIMTYAAILSLAILRDSFENLDRPGLIKYLQHSQRQDGSFRTLPENDEHDLRNTFCAAALAVMLNAPEAIDSKKAVEFIKSCRSYEGGYGQGPRSEAHGGTTYCAIASLRLLSSLSANDSHAILTSREQTTTIRWLLYNQISEVAEGGFRGRTEKEADACYSFWCIAALEILGARGLINTESNANFLLKCQPKFGGIAKGLGEVPDPYHTYLSLAALTISPTEELKPFFPDQLNASLNTTHATAAWIASHLTEPQLQSTLAL